MANKKISELDVRASLTLADLLVVGDPSTGYAYKITVNDLKTVTGAGVISFNGRVGAVVPTEGDYSLTQLSDTIITSAVADQLLKYNGSNWVNWTPNYLTAESDTLDSVTDRGSTTTNGITVGTMDVTGVLTGGDTIKSTNGTVTTSMSYGASAGIIGTTSNHSLEIRTNNVYRIGVNTSGVVNVSNLAGTGSRMVVTDAAGNLSSQAIPSGTVTSVGLSTGTTGTDVNVTGSPVTSSGSITLNIPDASATARGLITTGVQTIAGAKTFSGIAYFNNVVYLPNNTFDGSAAAFGGNNTATYLFGSYTYAYYKNIFNTAWSAGVLSNNPTAYLTTNLFLQRAITAPSTGSYGLVATVVIKGTPITANTGSVTTAAALVVDGTTTGATNNYSIWAAGGNIRFDSLAGTGSRMVVASATGVLSTQAIPTGTVTSVGVTVGTAGTDIAVSGSPITSSGTITIDIPTASATNRGALSSADWSTFNGKQNALTFGNLTESTSSVLTITGGTGAVIGSGSSIQVKQASSTVSGFLSSTDWNTFNNKQNALTNPITGDGSETSGNIAFFTGNTTIAGNTGLYWDNTNLRVGINCTPYVPLQVKANTGELALSLEGNSGEKARLAFHRNGLNAYYQWIEVETTNTSGFIKLVTNDLTRQQIGIAGDTVFSSTAATYAMSITNVHDSSQGLLVRSTDADTTLYLARFQSSASAVSQTWVDRFSIAKNGSTVIGDNIPAVNVRLWVKGEDQTASNYAMDVTDSAGQSIAWFRNDKYVRFYGGMQIPSNTWFESNNIGLVRDSYFGYSTSYRTVQIGSGSVSLGVTLTGNASGNFSGNEIVIPNNRGIIAPNAANNDYIGVIKVTSSNGINIGGNYTVNGWLQIASTGAATFTNSITSSYAYNGGGTGMIHLTSSGTEGGGITFEKTSGTAQKYKLGNSGSKFFLYNETAGNEPFSIANSGAATFNGQVNVLGYFSVYSDANYMGALGFNRKADTGTIYNSSYAAYQLQNYNGTFAIKGFSSAGADQGDRFSISSTGATAIQGNLSANSPSEGNTGEGIIAGRSFKIDASGSGQTAKMYIVSNTLSDTYGSGLQIQFANFANTRGFGFNLNTTGDYETYLLSSGSWVKRLTISPSGVLTTTNGIAINGTISNTGTGTGTYTQSTWYVDTSNQILFENGRQTDSASGTGRTVYFTWRGGPSSGGGVQLQHGTNAWAAYTSDARLKTKVADITNGLDTIMKLLPIKFKWTRELENSRTVTGFTAQNVEEAIPDAVFNSWKDEEIGDVKSYFQDYLIPYLVKAVQELNAKIDSK